LGAAEYTNFLLAKYEIHSQNQKRETRDMIPPQRLVAHERECKDRKDHKSYDLLYDLQLPQGERSSVFCAADAVCRHHKTIFDKGDKPTDNDNGSDSVSLQTRFERDLPVPRECHKDIRHHEQQYG